MMRWWSESAKSQYVNRQKFEVMSWSKGLPTIGLKEKYGMEEEYGMDPSICGILETEKVGSRQVRSKGDKSFSYKDLAPHQKPLVKSL